MQINAVTMFFNAETANLQRRFKGEYEGLSCSRDRSEVWRLEASLSGTDVGDGLALDLLNPDFTSEVHCRSQ